MKLASEFYRLPLQFDASCLAEEIAQFSEAEWRPHPQGHQGNTALPLIAANGDPTNESTKGPMRPTPYLERCAYLVQVLAALEAPLGRTRLMRIQGHGEATAHVDTNYYWSQHVRVHIPILTYPGVRFLCGEREVFMDAGECWLFDTWRKHNVLNPDDRPRIHLVADTVGSERFWSLVEQAERPFDQGSPQLARPPISIYLPGKSVRLETERSNFPLVMSPWEVQWLLSSIIEDLDLSQEALRDSAPAFSARCRRFAQQWHALWAHYGEAPEGWPAFRAEMERLMADLTPLAGQLSLLNRQDPVGAVEHWLVRAALNPDLAHVPGVATTGVALPATAVAAPAAPLAPARPAGTLPQPRFERPVFIIAAPRSGSSLLFETLLQAPGLYSIGGESHEVLEGIAELAPASRGYASNRLEARDASPAVVAQLAQGFWSRLRDRDGRPPLEGAPVRMLEKTPKNALRIPFLAQAFPDARFIYLYREPRDNIASMIEAWRSGRFVTYPNLPGWDGPAWSLLLIPGWQDLRGKALREITAAQWAVTQSQIMADLTSLPAERWCSVTYEDLLANPQAEAERLSGFAGLAWDRALTAPLPHSRHTLTPPDPEKWRRHAPQLEAVLPLVEQVARQARALVARHKQANEVAAVSAMPAGAGQAPAGSPAGLAATPDTPRQPRDARAAPAPQPAQIEAQPAAAPTAGTAPASPDGLARTSDAAPATVAAESLRSIHTSSFPELLHELGLSLFVSTYQAGKLVIVRASDGVLNTHFRTFNKPMGIALSAGRLAIGTELEIREFRNVPAVTRRLEPPGRHDASFLPRSAHATGDVQIHELEWASDELWFVNTRFSCLCTYSQDYSFVPRWRPGFISALAPEDRCHLNGLALISGRPAYVTALGESDQPRGWREHKKDGGILIDVERNLVIAGGLSMPHSPRWYNGQLWVLNSGEGGIGVVDPQSGRYQQVAQLPGFTRGLSFHGRYAFVGLSQVRESAVFSGIAIADLPLDQRACGVWVIDIISGKTVAFVKFEDAVQEIFAVQVAPGMRYPDLLNDDKSLISSSFVLPDAALESVPAHLR